MFDDILGKKQKETIEEYPETLIRAMKYNIKQKEKLIKKLIDKITELERQVESLSSETHAGI